MLPLLLPSSLLDFLQLPSDSLCVCHRGRSVVVRWMRGVWECVAMDVEARGRPQAVFLGHIHYCFCFFFEIGSLYVSETGSLCFSIFLEFAV